MKAVHNENQTEEFDHIYFKDLMGYILFLAQ